MWASSSLDLNPMDFSLQFKFDIMVSPRPFIHYNILFRQRNTFVKDFFFKFETCKSKACPIFSLFMHFM